jgi:hypothetical protein
LEWWCETLWLEFVNGGCLFKASYYFGILVEEHGEVGVSLLNIFYYN